MPMAECIFQGVIQDVDANVEEAMDSMPVPSNLLLLNHPFGDNLVDCGLGESG